MFIESVKFPFMLLVDAVASIFCWKFGGQTAPQFLLWITQRKHNAFVTATGLGTNHRYSSNVRLFKKRIDDSESSISFLNGRHEGRSSHRSRKCISWNIQGQAFKSLSVNYLYIRDHQSRRVFWGHVGVLGHICRFVSRNFSGSSLLVWVGCSDSYSMNNVGHKWNDDFQDSHHKKTWWQPCVLRVMKQLN